MRRRTAPGTALALAIGVILSTTPAISLSPAAAATTTVVERASGTDRFGTAVAANRGGFPSGSRVIFVANGTAFPDALAGGPAAAVRAAQLLLVGGSIPAAVDNQLRRFPPEQIVLLGGESAISLSLGDQLGRYASGGMSRLSGADRYQTAAAIAASAFLPNQSVVYIASGLDFPDALAAGAAAGNQGGPVLLVDRDGIPAATANELRRLAPQRIVVVGGQAVIPDPTMAALRTFTQGAVARISGADRYSTSAAVSSAVNGGTGGLVYLASGEGFADALGAGSSAARTPAPLLLVKPDCVPAEVKREVERLSPAKVIVLGGLATLTTEIDRLRECGQPPSTASTCPAPPVEPPEALGVSFQSDPTADVAVLPRLRRGLAMASCAFGPVAPFIVLSAGDEDALIYMIANFRNTPFSAQEGFRTSSLAAGGGTIVANTSRVRDYGSGKTIESLGVHEYFHLRQEFLGPVNLPRPTWLIEGSAEFAGYETTLSYGVTDRPTLNGVKKQFVAKDNPPLSTWEPSSALRDNDTSTFYGRSYAAAAFLAREHGAQGVLSTFWQGLRTSPTWQEAFSTTFGVTPTQFYSEFAAYEATVKAGGPV